jgi:hypothetical protein
MKFWAGIHQGILVTVWWNISLELRLSPTRQKYFKDVSVSFLDCAKQSLERGFTPSCPPIKCFSQKIKLRTKKIENWARQRNKKLNLLLNAKIMGNWLTFYLFDMPRIILRLNWKHGGRPFESWRFQKSYFCFNALFKCARCAIIWLMC